MHIASKHDESSPTVFKMFITGKTYYIILLLNLKTCMQQNKLISFHCPQIF